MDKTQVILEDYRAWFDSDYAAAFLRIRDCFLDRGYAGNILPPSGQVPISETIEFDFSDGTSYNSMNAINISGPGSANSQLYWTKGTNEPMFSVKSSSSGAGPIVNLHWSGFSVGTSINRKGTFFKSQYIGSSKFEDIVTFYLDEHYDLTDSLLVNFDKVQMSFGRRGLTATRGNFTNPNCINLYGGSNIGGMDEWGAVVHHGSAFSMHAGGIENNGLGDPATYPSRGGIFLESPGDEGGVAGNFTGGIYFEGNKGTADIYATANQSYPFALNVIGNPFNRKTGAALNHIRIDTDTGYKPVTVYHFGNEFGYFPDYTPDASRKVMAKCGSGPVLFKGDSHFKSALEAPDFFNDHPHASCMFNGITTARLRSNNVYGVYRHAVGQYSIIFESPSRGTHFVEAVTNGVHVHQIFSEDASAVRVHFLNLAGSCVDPDSVRIRVFS